MLMESLARKEQLFGEERPGTVEVSYPNTHERLHSSSNAYQGSGCASPNELPGVYPYSEKGSSVPVHWLALPMCLSIKSIIENLFRIKLPCVFRSVVGPV